MKQEIEVGNNGKKKILFYSDCFIFGGCENVLVNIFSSLRIRDSFDLHFAYARNREYESGVARVLSWFPNRYPLLILSKDTFYRFNRNDINKLFAEIYKLPFKILGKFGVYDVYNFIRLLLFFKKVSPDILYVNNGGYPAARSCLVAVLSARAAGIRSIVFNVNNLAEPQKNLLSRFIDALINRYVACFITASKAAGTCLSKNRRIDAAKIRNIPNTLLEENAIGILPGCLRSELGILSSTAIVGAVGLLTWRKGFNVLVDAIHLLEGKLEEREFKVVIFGEGEERANLERQIAAHGLGNRVCLPGFRANILNYMKDFDLFVLPSLDNEDFPYVILEAMSLKKPVIGSRVAGIPEQIDHGKSGTVVPPGDAKQLSEAIWELLRDPKRAVAMGDAGFLKYQKEYRYERIMGEYAKLFANL